MRLPSHPSRSAGLAGTTRRARPACARRWRIARFTLLLATAVLSALIALLALLAVSPAQAQTSPAHGAITTEDGMPLSDFLALLRQIAPAASEGAKIYLAAYRLQCGRALSTAELRHALAREGGDPVLMGLIRSTQQPDLGARHRVVHELVRQIRCPAGALR